jgi:hypothetical protein
MEVIATVLRAERRKIFDLEIARLFKIVVIGDKVGALLRLGSRRDK